MAKRIKPITPKFSVGRWVYVKEQPNARVIKIVETEFLEHWGLHRYRCTEEDGSPIQEWFAADELQPIDYNPNAITKI